MGEIANRASGQSKEYLMFDEKDNDERSKAARKVCTAYIQELKAVFQNLKGSSTIMRTWNGGKRRENSPGPGLLQWIASQTNMLLSLHRY